MRERDRPDKPKKPSVDGEKVKTKSSSSKSSTSKPSASSSKTSSSKTSSSRKLPSSSTKTDQSSPKPKSSSSSSKPSKTSSSSLSSKTQSLERRAEKLSSSSTKLHSEGSKERRSERSTSKRVDEDRTSRESRKNEKSSSRKDIKGASDSTGREPRRSDRTSTRKTEKLSESLPEKEFSRNDKASRSQGRSKAVSSTSKENNSGRTTSDRRVVKGESSSSKSRREKPNESNSRTISPSKRSSVKESDKKRDKPKSKSGKDEMNREEKGKGDRVKSTHLKEKSAREHRSSRKERIIEDDEQENRDSGIEGMQIRGGAVTAALRSTRDVDTVEVNQNSLETLESGISLSSPRDLSGDEVEVEESISSKMVEVDEVAEEGMQDVEDDEAVIGDEFQEEDEHILMDEGAIPDAYMEGNYPSISHIQNSVDLSSSLTSHKGIPAENVAKEGGNESPDKMANVGATETENTPLENGLAFHDKEPDEKELDADKEDVKEDGGDDNEYDEYEEDFESYESDFEEDTDMNDEEEDEDDEDENEETEDEDENEETEDEDDDDDEEEKAESDIQTKDPTMVAVLQAMERENNFENRSLERQYSFDDPSQDPRPSTSKGKEKQVPPSPKETKNPSNARPKTARSFVNFAGAKKKQEAAHVSSKMNSRGRALLNMIQLDNVSIDLFTLAPVSYEAYISSFGHSNRQQISVQTNEDALNEETQTEELVLRDKWTQKPVNINIGKDNQLPGPEDYLGVGGDTDLETFTDISKAKSSTAKLTSFLTSASQIMLVLLEEELVWETAEMNRPNSASMTTDGLGFSQPPVSLGTNLQTLLEGRTTPFVEFCPAEPSMILSGHGFHSLEEDAKVELNDSGLLCVWWVQEPSRPRHLLSCCASPTAACFSPARPSLVLAGLQDGSLAAWDLREPLHLHTLDINIDDVKWKVRVPSFVTACSESGEGEGSAIVSIYAVTTEQDLESDKIGSFQVVTLTTTGQVTWWVVMKVPLTNTIGNISLGRKSATTRSTQGNAAVSPHLGASPWARIAINRAATINVANALYGTLEHFHSDEAISSEVACHDLKLDMNDPSQLYVATGSGAVAHCSRHTSRIHPKAYMPEIEPGCEALCIALCPHDSRYMLVGSSDGLVRLHSMASERPLTSWQSAPDCSPIHGVQWSPARPCVFYVLDSLARLHIWDLSAGDIFPIMTVEAGGLVGGVLGSFSIAPTHPTSHHPLYAVFASDGGEMVLRQVGPEFGTHQIMDDYTTELERFTYYVNII
ncbi:hypothetical protein SK128_005225 [Halocaridina rubra]|uniref:WD repeat-containing protein 60 n=1 Tax=Halocaridina rubra TaxID=373956 RepID=A0AAN8XGS0_HALRR